MDRNTSAIPDLIRKPLMVLTLLLVLASLVAIGLQGERYASEGLEYYRRGDYKTAMEMFKTADRSASGSKPEYHYWLGRISIALQDSAQAKAWLTRYGASGDTLFKDQADGFLEILNRTERIFEKVDTRPMPTYMNSRNSDYGVVVTPDGKQLYFTSLRPARNEKENIFRAERLNNLWGRPFPVEELNTDKNEAVGSFSNDGTIMYLSGNYERGKIDGDIYSSTLINGIWQTPVNIPELNSSQVEAHPYIFEDKWMFFSSSRDGGFGGTDIYVSELLDGTWQSPENLGEMINTAGNEQTPFLHYDGKTLFFSSNAHVGFGGYDIFKAVKIGDKWTDWSIPENLGLPINSTKNERHYYQARNSDEVFLSTDIMADNFENILAANVEYAPREYQILDEKGEKQSIVDDDAVVARTDAEQSPGTTDSTSDKSSDTTDLSQERINEPEVPKTPDPIRITGTVQDDLGKAVQTDVQITWFIESVIPGSDRESTTTVIPDPDRESIKTRYTETVPTDSLGNFQVTVPYADRYNLVINKDKHFLFSKDLDPGEAARHQNIVQQRMIEEKVFVFNNILFDFDSAVLKKVSMPILNEIVLTLLNNPEIKVEISGHTCNIGTPEYNLKLSDRRAASVVNYLVSKGIDRSRLVSKGYGLTKPAESNATLAGKIKNRRVEVKVIK